MAGVPEPVNVAEAQTNEASAQEMGGPSAKSAKKFQTYIRGVHTIVGTQHFLKKSAKSSVLLFGRNQETAEATRNTSFKMQFKAEELYNKYMKAWILAPDGRFRRRWDLLQMLCMLYISIVIPFRVGLGISAEGGWYIFELTIDAYFYLDLVLNFFTGHQYADGALIMVPKDVALNYLKTWFPLDFVACLPVDLILRVVQGTFYCSLNRTCHQRISTAGMLFRLLKILRLFKLIKLVRLFSIRRLLDRYQHDLFLVLPFLSVAQMFIVILFLGHLYGCFFYYFSTSDWRTPAEKRDLAATLSSSQGTPADNHKVPWIISEFGGEYGTPGSMGLASRYIGALYWAFATLCTVGYGDISAKTEGERVFAIVSMITGGFVFSGVIAKIGSLVAKLDAAKTAHNDKMDAVTAFIREHKMPRELRSQVLIFFTKQQVRAYNVRTILSQMPYDLRSSILLYLYRDIIKKVPFFDGTDDIFITDVCLRLTPATYAAGTYIYTSGEIGRDLLVVVKGEVEVLGPLKQVTRVLYEGSYFGEGCILGDVRRMESVRARTPCSLCVLEADDLEELLITYPEMDKMLRRVYSRRKQQFQSATNSFSSVPSPGPRDRRRHSTDPNGAVPRAPDAGDALRLLAGGPKPPGKLPPRMDLRATARLSRSATNGAGLSEWSEPESPLGKEEATLLSESLGFGSPPQEQDSPGGEVESKTWKPRSRLFNNQVVPEEMINESTSLRADPALGRGASTDTPQKAQDSGNEPEGRTGDGARAATSVGGAKGVTISETDWKKSVTEQTAAGNGDESLTGHRKLSAQGGGQVKWAGGGNLKLVVNGDAETGDTCRAESPEAGPSRLSEGRQPQLQELPAIMSFRRRSSTGASVLGAHEPSTGDARDSGTSSGLSGIRAELRNLRQEVKMLRAEHRQDAALVQDQYKAIMSLLLKVSRHTVSGQGADNDFFVHA